MKTTKNLEMKIMGWCLMLGTLGAGAALGVQDLIRLVMAGVFAMGIVLLVKAHE